MHGIKSPLPSGWTMKTLGETLEYVQYGLSMPAFEQGTYPMFRMSNFENGLVTDNNLVYVELSDNEASKFLLEKGDILFNRTNSAALVGKTGIFLLPGEFVFASYLIRLRVNREVAHPEYINYVLNDPSIKQLLARLATPGASQCNINPTTLQAKVVFPLPLLAEQKRIADTLQAWDDALALQNRKLLQLRKRKDGIAQGLLSQHKRMPGFSRAARLVKAGSIFLPVSKRGHEQEELLSVTQDKGVLPRSMLEGRVVMPEGTTAGYKLVESGNFVISLRSFQGGLEYSEYRGLVSPAYTVLESTPQVVPDFYKHYFKSADFVQRLSSAVIGIRDGKQISFKDFSIINIPHPDPAEQRAIAEVLNTADAEIRLEEQKLTALRNQKRGLLHQLLTGQLRLS